MSQMIIAEMVYTMEYNVSILDLLADTRLRRGGDKSLVVADDNFFKIAEKKYERKLCHFYMT